MQAQRRTVIWARRVGRSRDLLGRAAHDSGSGGRCVLLMSGFSRLGDAQFLALSAVIFMLGPCSIGDDGFLVRHHAGLSETPGPASYIRRGCRQPRRCQRRQRWRGRRPEQQCHGRWPEISVLRVRQCHANS